MHYTTSRPASPELIARIQAALDSGLTNDQFVQLIRDGQVSGSNVGRALRGYVLSDRTIRSLERCCTAFEQRQGVPVPPGLVVAPTVAEPVSRSVTEVDPRTRMPVRTQPTTDGGYVGTVLDLLETWARRPGDRAAEVRMILRALQAMPVSDPSRRIERLIATCK